MGAIHWGSLIVGMLLGYFFLGKVFGSLGVKSGS